MSYRIMKIPACLFEPMIEKGVHVMTDAIDPIEDPKILDVHGELTSGSTVIVVLVESRSFPGPMRKEGDPVGVAWDIASEYQEFTPRFRQVATRSWIEGAERSE